MKRILSFALLLLVHCGGELDGVEFDPLINRQPKVLSVIPADGENGHEKTTVEMLFSQPVDPKTVTAKSVLVVPLAEGDVDPLALLKQAKDNKLTAVEGHYEVSPDGLTVRFHAARYFPAQTRCGVLVTPHLFSREQLPFNQTPGSGPNPFFSSFYTGGSAGGGESSSGGSATASTPALPKASFLKLNEIFYDAVGADGEGDLFIELLGEPDRDISGYHVYLVNGGDGKITGTIKIPTGMKTRSDGLFIIADAIPNQSGVTKVVTADMVLNFDPQNGPDCVQLVDPSGKLADAVGYGSPLVLRGENGLLCYEGTPGPDAPAGSSISRLPDAPDTDNNAADWAINNVPTPGSLEVE